VKNWRALPAVHIEVTKRSVKMREVPTGKAVELVRDGRIELPHGELGGFLGPRIRLSLSSNADEGPVAEMWLPWTGDPSVSVHFGYMVTVQEFYPYLRLHPFQRDRVVPVTRWLVGQSKMLNRDEKRELLRRVPRDDDWQLGGKSPVLVRNEEGAVDLIREAEVRRHLTPESGPLSLTWKGSLFKYMFDLRLED
jgi:hypothetical protein